MEAFSPMLFAFNEANFLLPLALFVVGWLVGWSVRHRQAGRERVPEHEPLDVIWCWREVHKRLDGDFPGLVNRVRFVWRPPSPSRTRDTGVAHLDDGVAEVYANVVEDEAEAVVTAVHELVHLQLNSGRHNREFHSHLLALAFPLGKDPSPSPQFKNRASINVVEAMAIADAQVDREAKVVSRRPVTLRWHRRARVGAAP